MRKFLLLFLFMFPLAVGAQMVIADFDTIPADSNHFFGYGGSNKSVVDYSIDNTTYHDGTGALRMSWVTQAAANWGGFAKLELWHPDSNGVWDFTNFSQVSFWYYVEQASSAPGQVIFRLQFFDIKDGPLNTTNGGEVEFYYSFQHILDSLPGWHKFTMPMVADPNYWNGEGFNLTGWAGQFRDGILDLDWIRGIGLEFSVEGTLYGANPDTAFGTLLIDQLQVEGVAPITLIFFNGRDVPTSFSSWGGWGPDGTSTVIDPGTGYLPGTNSIKWTQGAGWGGWCGMWFEYPGTKNLSANWLTDSLKFKMKAPAETDTVILQLNDSNGKQAKYFLTPAEMNNDNTWKQIRVALKDIVLPGDVAGFDSTLFKKLDIMTAKGKDGLVAYLTDIWTGNPVIDVVVPNAPTGISGIPGDYYNLVIWADVPGESNEVYNVYASESPITDLNAQGVELVESGVLEGQQSIAHYIYYPLKDKAVQYYYAVTCKDEAGNIGEAGVSGVVSNTAKGIPTISLTPPANFVADGDMSEWEATDIIPLVLMPEGGDFGHIGLGSFDDDNDLTATCYLAIDDDYFYFAADVIDDVYSFDPAGNFYEDDVIELYIGLYNTVKKHSGFQRGAEPDYKFIILSDSIRVDQVHWVPALYGIGDENYEFMNFGSSDWAVEVKVPLDYMVTGNASGDTRFHPQNGMKITMDINFHDSDVLNQRQGLLALSEISNDASYIGAQYWAHTWIGDTNNVATGIDDKDLKAAYSYKLEQNYPNPFNPETTIDYALAQAGKVKVEVYNLLGQKVETLVNEFQPAGTYTVKFDGAKLSSGVYFYKIHAGDFTQTRKMVLMR